MLQIVMRSAIDSERMSEPRYSTQCPVAAPAPLSRITRRMAAFARTPGEVRPPHGTAAEAQPLESLRARTLVDQVAVDVEQRLSARQLRDHVCIPDLLEQGLGHGNLPSAGAGAGFADFMNGQKPC